MALLWLLAVPAIAAKKNQSDGDDSVPWQKKSQFVLNIFNTCSPCSTPCKAEE